MTRLLLLADTHVPKRARDLPPRVWREIDRADIVIHAGDWVDLVTVDAIESRARRLVAVWGNNDGADIRLRFPEVARIDVDGLAVAVVHETGPTSGREARCEAVYPEADLLVFGHSHIPWDTTSPRGLRLLNPGSPTDRRRQPQRSFMVATVDEGRLDEVELVRFDP